MLPVLADRVLEILQSSPCGLTAKEVAERLVRDISKTYPYFFRNFQSLRATFKHYWGLSGRPSLPRKIPFLAAK
jgi:hypothetical protein